MVKNWGGKNAKKIKRSSVSENDNRVLEFKEDSQVYGKVLKLLGDSRCLIACDDGKERQCTVRGKLKKRVWINLNDIVLVSLRDFQQDKGDIIHKYNDSESKKLEKMGELGKINSSKLNSDINDDNIDILGSDDDGIDFEDI